MAQADQEIHNIALTIPEIVLLDINDATQISLNVTAPASAGNPPTGDTDNSKELWYTSILSGGTQRNITVESDAAVPTGLTLNVAASTPSGGFGTVGTGTNVDLTTSAQAVVTGIGSCYTTRTGGNGSQITYTLTVDNTQIGSMDDTDDTTLQVTYTLTDP